MYPTMAASPPRDSPLDEVFPAPHFEGSEKRIELVFDLPSADSRGLRELSRQQIDELMTLAACEVVATRHSDAFDGYVLSESSLFVYADRFVLKTCGTTRLLNSVPACVALASDLGLALRRVRYSRASFLFPECQPALYRDWSQEVAFLNHHLVDFPGTPYSYVMGDALSGLQWHVYVSDADATAAKDGSRESTYSVEVCMTELGRDQADQFRRLHPKEAAAECTRRTGIADMFPKTLIDDYVFDPCGYSMNGVHAAGFCTIHVTPEPECSYASCEASNWDPAKMDPAKLAEDCAGVFLPGKMTVALTTDADSGSAWDKHVLAFRPPAGYRPDGVTVQSLGCGGRVTFLRFTLADARLAAAVRPGSPKGIERVIRDTSAGIPAPLDVPVRDTDTPIYLPGSPIRNNSPKVQSPRAPAKALSDALQTLCGDNAAAVQRAIESLGAVDVLPSAEPAVMDEHLAKLVREHNLEDNFFVYDVGRLARSFACWNEAMPRVEPFYAVKCNPEPAIVAALTALGCGFDCASKAEVDLVLQLGAAPSRVIYANPCKKPSELRALASSGVDVTTFDSADELFKVKQLHPDCRVVLRIRADDPDARCKLGNKYGAEMDAVPHLLDAVTESGATLVGVSFHVGSGARNPNAFSEAILKARQVFDMARERGMELDLLDIGGGFMLSRAPDGSLSMGAVPAAINSALDMYFPPSSNVRIIAEPGRLFAEHAGVFASQVFGRRVRPDYTSVEGDMIREYWLADGLYGSFNCVLYDGAEVGEQSYRALSHPALETLSETERFTSTVFGPTCDGLDTVMRGVPLPEMRLGDFLVFDSFGAYTIAGACNFNGLKVDRVPTFVVVSERG